MQRTRGHTQEAEKHIRGCRLAIYSSLGPIAGEEDVAGLLWERQNTSTGENNNEGNIRGPSGGEDPEELIILDQLMIELERTIKNSIATAWARRENRNRPDRKQQHNQENQSDKDCHGETDGE